MAKPAVYVLDPYHPDAIKALLDAPVEVVLDTDARRSQWQANAAAVLVRSQSRITAADLAKASSLKAIVRQGVGVDNIDIEAARKAGVAVCNTPALNSEAVAELTIALALSLARRVTELDHRLRQGEAIVRTRFLGQSLFQKTIGVIGMGNIGRCVAQKWIGAMSGQIVAYDPYLADGAWPDIPHRRVHQLEALLEVSDVVTLHVPLTNGTRNLIAAPQFARMKRNVILLNCSRGGIVDEAALVEALAQDRIFGAALDALETEPPSLEKHRALLQHHNVILTPHVGASTVENLSRSGLAAVQTLLQVLGGEDIPNRVV